MILHYPTNKQRNVVNFSKIQPGDVFQIEISWYSTPYMCTKFSNGVNLSTGEFRVFHADFPVYRCPAVLTINPEA